MKQQAELLERIISYAAGEERITALFLVGSQVRREGADQYSDIDLVAVAKDAAYFAHTDGWLSEIGRYYVSFTEKIDEIEERRVLFEGALDVDFIFLPEQGAGTALHTGVIGEILCHGYQILVDKKGLEGCLPGWPSAGKKEAAPEEGLYYNAVHDFWYHTVWAGKKLLRGELWAAKFCLDCYLKQKLLQMMEWNELAENGPGYNTWFGGRFVDTWAGAQTREQLAASFAHYNEQDMTRALLKTMGLFRRLAGNTAAAAGYPYPQEADDYCTAWVEQSLCSRYKEL